MSRRKRKNQIAIVPILLLVVAIALFGYYWINKDKDAPPAVSADSSLVMRVIDVGQGDSILLCCDNEYMLVDCGEKYEVEAVLEQLEGVESLKYLVATHPHTDHMGGVVTVMQTIKPELFLMPEKEHTSIAFKEMLDTVEELEIDAAYAYAGDEYTLGSARITIVSPEEGAKESDLNNNSVVMLVQYGDVSILLTGDSEAKMERQYVKRLDGKVDIYKVAHHGSDTSNTEALLSVIKPTYAAISCGEGNQFGHPIKSVMDTLNKYCESIYRTDESGDITFTVKEGKIDVTTER